MAGAGGLSAAARAVLDGAEPLVPDAPLVVALSGGADSAVCAWAAVRLRRPVRAVSVDHGLPFSDTLMSAAAGIAAGLGIDHLVVPVAAGSGEGELRDLRYAALEAEAGEAEHLATGHTADDHAETVLAHVLRGSGAPGLSGIPLRRGRWVRPLLRLPRSLVRAAASDLRLPAVEDPANEDRAALRNRIRHDVLPVLRRQVNPAVDSALARAARLAVADEDVLAARAAGVPLRVRGDEVRIPAAALGVLPSAVASRVVRRALRFHLAPYAGSEDDVARVLAVARGETSSVSLPGGLEAVREAPWVVLHAAASPDSPAPTPLPVPGSVTWGTWGITAQPLHRPPHPVGRRQADLDAGTASDLVVRGAVPGDRIDIGSGSQPVVEALREAGVPARLRPGWPVVDADGRMAWVAGARPAAWAAARGPGEVIRLTLGDG